MSKKNPKARPAKAARRPAATKKIATKKTAGKKTAAKKSAKPAARPAAKKAASKKPAVKPAPRSPAPKTQPVKLLAKPSARPAGSKGAALRGASNEASPKKENRAIPPAAAPRPAGGGSRSGSAARNQPPPPSRPVPAKEVDRFRKALDIKKTSIVHSFNEYRERSQGLGDDGTQDIGDQATNSYNKEFFLSLSEEHRNQIHAIDEALRRIDRGVYGICAACGEEIDMPRLNAVPWSTLCLKCQESMDQER